MRIQYQDKEQEWITIKSDQELYDAIIDIKN